MDKIITRNNFQSINSLICLTINGRNENKQKINKNLVFNHLLIFLILLCGDIHINPGPIDKTSEKFLNEYQKINKLKGLKIIDINAISIVNKINELRVICNQLGPDFLCKTESWLNSGHEDFEFPISGYDLYRKDHSFSTGGEVCVYVKKSNKSSIDVIENNVNIEMICIEVMQKRTKKFSIIALYRPPNADINYTYSLLVFLEEKSVIGALSGQVLLMIYSDRTQRADSEYIYGSRSKKSSQGQNNKKLNMPKMENEKISYPLPRVLYIYIYIPNLT